jgi:hypothetical protein
MLGLDRRIVPIWLQHSIANKFLDSDLWVHDQERVVRSGENKYSPKNLRLRSVSDISSNYVMKTESDTGTRAWRTWWTRFGLGLRLE